MLALTKIFLHNWHRFDSHLIEVEDSLYLAGHNGSGKSSVLDAIQLVLIADLQQVRFNSSAQDRSQRTLDSYVRGKIGEERYLRPGNTIAYIALEWTNKQNGERFVCGVCIEAGEKGVERSFFLISEALNRETFIPNGRPMTRRDLRQAFRQRRGARLFDQIGEYREELLNRLGGLSPRFFDLFLRALTFQPIRDIREFVEQWLLEPDALDVETLHSVVERLHTLETHAREVQGKLQALDDIIKTQADIRRQQELNAQYSLLAALLQHAEAETRLNSLSQRIETAQTQLKATRDEADLVATLIDNTQKDLTQAQVQLHQSDIVRRRDTLEREIAHARAEADRISRHWQELRRELQAFGQPLGQLRDLLPQEPTQTLIALIETLGAGPPPADLSTHLQAMQPALDATLNDQQRQYFELEQRIKSLHQRGAELQAELEQLRRGIRPYPPAVERLRQKLAAELGQTPSLLCELLQIPDERWQNAVEALLGQRRFNVIVPPKDYPRALDLLDQLRASERIYDVGLIDLEQAKQERRPARPASLARQVTTKAARLQPYIDSVLGDIITCESVRDLRGHRRAVTPEVVVYQEWTARAIDPKHFTPWFIGDRAGRSQIEARESELSAIGDQLAELAPQLQQLERSVQQLQGSRDRLPRINHGLSQPLDEAPLRQRISEAEAELESLDLSGLESLENEVKRLQGIINGHQQNQNRLQQEIGRLNDHIKQLDSQIRDAQRILQERSFSVNELSQRHADMLEAAQALFKDQTANAPDYATLVRNAENKKQEFETRRINRIQALAEQATTYNTQYRFSGRASDPNESAYAIERDRLQATDLPRYTDQIAHAKAEAEEELREHVLHKLRENIYKAKNQLERINDALRNLDFHGDRYRFRSDPSSDLQDFYELIMEAKALGTGPLFESEFYAKHKPTFDRFYGLLTSKPQSPAEEREQAALSDYRRYLTYDIEVTHQDGQRSRLSKIMGQTSGGETQTPFYLTIAASFMQLYRVNERSDRATIRLVAFDEAFSKMDQDRIGSTLELFQQFKLQIITATPLERCEYLVPKMCTNLVLTGVRDTVFIEPYRNYAARLELDSD